MVHIDITKPVQFVRYSHIQHEDCENRIFMVQRGGARARGIIGSYEPFGDGKGAYVVRGYGLDSEGAGSVYGNDIPQLALDALVSHDRLSRLVG
jgi:hypothetical protein